jgi:hypothetical protein
VEIFGVLVFLFLICTLEKHNLYGLRDFFSDKYKTDDPAKDMSVEEFDFALEKFNKERHFDFQPHSSTKEGQPRGNVKEVYKDSKSERSFFRIRKVETDEIITACAPDEAYQEHPKYTTRPKRGFWGDKLDPKGDQYFKDRQERVQRRSDMARWQKKLDEEE